jgi:hypothetical protein
VRAPLPQIKLMPTGGVTLDNAGEWIRAGAVAVGLGSALVDAKAIDEGRFDVITANASASSPTSPPRVVRRSAKAARSIAPMEREASAERTWVRLQPSGTWVRLQQWYVGRLQPTYIMSLVSGAALSARRVTRLHQRHRLDRVVDTVTSTESSPAT